MKQGKIAMMTALALAAAMLLTACTSGGTSTPASAAPVASSTAETSAAPAAEPGSTTSAQTEEAHAIVMERQEYDADDETGIGTIYEVPQMTGDSSAITEINVAINEFADFTDALAENPELLDYGQSAQVKAYPQTGDDYLQIVMTRQLLPNYATHGWVASFIYDIKNDAVLSAVDAMDAYGIDGEELKEKLKNWDGLYESMVVTDVSIDGARFVDGGCEIYLKYWFDNPDAEGGDDIVTYSSVDDTFYPYTELFVDPRDLDHLDPPLYYDQEGNGLPSLTGEWASITEEGTPDTLTFTADSVVYYDAAADTEHEGTYTQRANVVLFSFDDLGEVQGTAYDQFVYMDNDMGGSTAFTPV